jgi:hypothetical protein
VWEFLVKGKREKISAWRSYHSGKDEAVLQKARERADTLQEHQIRSLDFLARLAAVDGALLITDHYRLLGFGVEVRSQSEVNTIEIARVPKYPDGNLTPGGTEPIERHGTRHRSAFRFCKDAQQCGAFILSQDGGVKAVRYVDGAVHMWRNVSVG